MRMDRIWYQDFAVTSGSKIVQNDVVILNNFIKVNFHLNGYIFIKTIAHELLEKKYITHSAFYKSWV